MKLVFPNARVRQHLSKMGMPLFCFGVAQQWRIAREYISATAHHESTDERELSDRALARAMWHSRWATWSLYALVVLILLLVFDVGAHAQLTNVNITKVGNTSQTTDTLKVNCVSGCGGGSSNATIISPLDLSGNVEVSVQNATIAITASSLPLPSGASTGAKQDTGNASLSSIDGKVILPSALDGSGYLKTHEQGVPHTICDSGCGGAASFTDNSAFTFGTTAVNNMGAVVDDVSTNAVAENSSGTPRMSTSRILFGDLKNTQTNANPLNVQQPYSATQTATWTSATPIDTALSMSVLGYSVASVSVVSVGGSSGILSFEVSDDSGTSWYLVRCNLNLNNGTDSVAAQSSIITVGQMWVCPVAPATNFRARLSTVISNGAVTATLNMNASAVSSFPRPTATLSATQSGSWTVSANAGSGTFTVKADTFANQTSAMRVQSAEGAIAPLGSSTDAKSTATDTTSTSAISLLKEISSLEQAPVSRAVTNAGTFATQSTLAAETTKVIGTVNIASSQTVAAVTAITNALPSGTNTLGSVKLTDGTTVPGVIAGTTALKTDMSSVAGTATPTGNGTVAAGVQRVAIASDNTAFAVNATLGTETTKVIGTVNIASAQTLATVSAVTAITNALPAGTNLLGKVGFDQTTPGSTNAVQELPDTIAGVALSASGKATVTTSVNVKASAGNVYGFSVTNGAASICWIQFVNNSGNGTLGTLPIFSVAIPASGTVNYPPGSFPLANFSSGIAVGISTAVNGASACGTAGNITVFYK